MKIHQRTLDILEKLHDGDLEIGTVYKAASSPIVRLSASVSVADFSELPEGEQTKALATETDDGRKVWLIRASGYGNVDRHGEVIESGAFADTTADKFVLLWGHDAAALPIGTPEYVFETASALVVGAAISATRPDIERLLVEGAIKSASVGFVIREYKVKEHDDGISRLHITKAELLELSLVNIPANPEARVLRDFPGADAATVEEAPEEEAAVEEGVSPGADFSTAAEGDGEPEVDEAEAAEKAARAERVRAWLAERGLAA